MSSTKTVHMPAPLNLWLVFAAALSAVAAALHIGIVFGGASWFRFFGAGERFARAAEQGRVWQHVLTLCIAAVLALWSAYALAGAGVLPRLPLLGTGLLTITVVYLLRGLVIVPLLLFARRKATPFAVWSSLICLGYGLVHAVGVAKAWPSL